MRLDIYMGPLFRLAFLMLGAGVVLPWALTLVIDYPALPVSAFGLGFAMGLLLGAYRMIGVFVSAYAQRKEPDGQ